MQLLPRGKDRVTNPRNPFDIVESYAKGKGLSVRIYPLCNGISNRMVHTLLLTICLVIVIGTELVARMIRFVTDSPSQYIDVGAKLQSIL